MTRKRKLLEKQKRGKARMKMNAKVPLSQKAFWAAMSIGGQGGGKGAAAATREEKLRQLWLQQQADE